MLTSLLRNAIYRLSNSLPVHEHHQVFVPKKWNKRYGKRSSEDGRKGRMKAKMWTPVLLPGSPVFSENYSKRASRVLRRGGRAKG